MSCFTSELRVRLAHCKTGLSPPVKYFTDRSKVLLLFWIFFVVSVLRLLCLCAHLLGKGWSLGSRLWCLTVSLSLSYWYPGSGVVLDCIDSWSLHPYLLQPGITKREIFSPEFRFVAGIDQLKDAHGGVTIIARSDMDGVEIDIHFSSECVAKSRYIMEIK